MRAPARMSRNVIPTSPKHRVLASIALCVFLALAAAVLSVRSISLLPPKIEARSLAVAGAGARVMVDNPQSLVSDRLATDGDYQTLNKRSILLGNLMSSRPVRELIARRAGLKPDELSIRTRVTANAQAVLTEPGSERRATNIRDSQTLYHLEVHPDPTLPTLSLYAQAPTVAEAERVANSAAPGIRDYLRGLASRKGIDPINQVVLEQPARARGAIINGKANVVIFGLTFIFVFVLSAGGMLLAAKLRRKLSAGGMPPRPEYTPPPPAPARPRAPARERPVVASVRQPGLALTPAVAMPVAMPTAGGGVIALPGTPRRMSDRRLEAMSRRAALKAGDWPRTTRVLPWLLAVMMAVVWLVPFNDIELAVSLPVDLKFDRLILPFIILTWVLALAAGGEGAPRLRLTWIHLAVGAVAVAFLLSIVLGARELNQTLELDTSLKQLTVLVSYISLFVIAASSIRYREVPAFLKYTLVLALLMALGTIWEYRFQYNIFYSASNTILPGNFTIGEAESAAVGTIGRRVVRGPGAVPLEAVAMLAMGLGIAVVGLIQAKVTRKRILYGLMVALILAAATSTERKSGLIAPVSVFVTLAYFRRRELIRLAPLGVLIGVLMLMITPGAAQTVVGQLSGEKLNSVATVSDRTADYDAVRPDVFTHLAFGRGYGSYEHRTYRILDMELLGTLIEVGVVGLLAYILMLGTVVAVARRPIRERRPHDSAVALSAAAAAVALLVVSNLFDVMSFPHCPYIALWMAALLAVVVAKKPDDEPEGAWST